MLLSLSQTYSDTVALDESGRVTCDMTFSEQVVSGYAEYCGDLFRWLAENLPRMWRRLVPQIAENPWVVWLGQNPEAILSYSVILVGNDEVQTLNREYRHKDAATDVLTFSLAEQDGLPAPVGELYLGEVYVSLDWAVEAVCKQTGVSSRQKLNFFRPLSLYIIERLTHGTLHLLGVHHDTMSDYNKVVTIQQAVIHALSEENDESSRP